VPRHEDVLGNECIAPRILNLDIRWRSVLTFTPHPLYHRSNSSRHPPDKKLGGPQNWSGSCWKEKKTLSLPLPEA